MRIWLIAVVVCAAMAAAGEDRSLDARAPGVVTRGSGNTIIGGQPAARSSAAASDPGVAIDGASPNGFINGRLAVTVGDTTGCRGIAIGGQSDVFINAKPVLVRAGDLTLVCPWNSCRG
jgi:uncharacterized Zn-binding protein involved in type VI secretion